MSDQTDRPNEQREPEMNGYTITTQEWVDVECDGREWVAMARKGRVGARHTLYGYGYTEQEAIADAKKAIKRYER